MFDEVTNYLRKIKPDTFDYEDQAEYLAALTMWARTVTGLAHIFSTYAGAPSEQEFKEACNYL